MSAIVGIYHLNGCPVDLEHLGLMMEALAHRGTDGVGTWLDRSVGLGSRMLWTTPESLLEQLPLKAPEGDFVLVSDARIDNRSELIAQLDLGGRPSDKVTDSDLILASYQKWGDQCPAYLLGDFAFAIWDQRHQILFCARDPMGVKPFYYYHTGQIFLFASEIKALLALPMVPRRINEAMVADYLAKILFSIRKEDSFYRDIQELRATQSITVSRDAINIQTYWTPDLSKELKLASDQEYVEAFKEIFVDAVRCRLRSAFPVGSTLSGGLDSSSIACTARDLLQQAQQPNIRTFSAIFPSLAELDPRIDERVYMNAVIDQGNLESHWVRTDLVSPLVDLERVVWHGEEPSPAPNLYLDWEVFKAAREHNVRVLFTGIDGDTTITYGIQYLAELAGSFHWLKLLQEGSALAKVWNRPRRGVIWDYGISPVIPESLLRMKRRLQGRLVDGEPVWDIKSTLLRPEFAERMNVFETVQSDAVQALEGGRSSLSARQEHWLALNNGSVRYALQWLDKVASAFSLEARHPFCDRRLVEFCLALPSSQKLYQGWTRSILRRSMADILPPEVQWRRGKGNLSANFKKRLLEDERQRLEQIIFREYEGIEPYIDIPALQLSYQRYAANPLVTDEDATNIFVAVNLALWIQQSQIQC
ncbi:MAG: lasso peptide isopeptide bond-forming cyclase [Kovacikia sp.]